MSESCLFQEQFMHLSVSPFDGSPQGFGSHPHIDRIGVLAITVPCPVHPAECWPATGRADRFDCVACTSPWVNLLEQPLDIVISGSELKDRGLCIVEAAMRIIREAAPPHPRNPGKVRTGGGTVLLGLDSLYPNGIPAHNLRSDRTYGNRPNFKNPHETDELL